MAITWHQLHNQVLYSIDKSSPSPFYDRKQIIANVFLSRAHGTFYRAKADISTKSRGHHDVTATLAGFPRAKRLRRGGIDRRI